MSIEHDRARRHFLQMAGTAVVAGAVVGLSGCRETALDRGLVFRDLDAALAELDRLAGASQLRSGTAWSWPQTLVHCAQSIEYSFAGYPQAKPPLFQKTVGAAAFRVFAWRERMSHDLAEGIPGAPALEAETDAAAARQRLLQAIAEFRAAGSLQPHFAYGALTKAEYEQAHAMHLANHFSAFEVLA